MPVLAIDIGGTAVKYALMGRERDILSRGSVPTPQEGREALLDCIGRLFDSSPGCEGLAVSLPGIIDTEKGQIIMGGALRYNDGFFFRDALQTRCGVPVHLENDAKCAALAEAAEGALRDVPNGMVLLFGTMIGAALIQDHRLYRGSHFSAGEISYLITDRLGLPTVDGVWGNRCGVPRLCRLYSEAAGLNASTVDGRAVFEAVQSGDAAACEALRQYAAEIAVQIFNFQNLYDPDRFAIGGGISAQPALLEALCAQLAKLYEICPYPVRRAELVPCAFRNDANLHGAYLAYRERYSL